MCIRDRGKGEIDETMIQGVKDCLDARELIKLKVLENSMYLSLIHISGCWKKTRSSWQMSVPAWNSS